MIRKTARTLALLLLPMGAAACTVDNDGGADTAGQVAAAQPAQQPAPQPASQPAPPPADTAKDLAIEVDLSDRRLHVMKDGQHAADYPVAVGSSEWPTETGQWTIKQVVWNPEWIPPKSESWAEDEEAKDPGDPDNPLGRVQLVYDLPRTIHGTNNPSSIGKAVSHGSIRMRNEDAITLAKRIMEAAGVGKDQSWYSRVQSNRSTKEVVDLPRQVPITVKQ